ncbi:hypothetical protein CALVIDRAFT_263536 [Calocera viscosa TUFC12733]|uniref:Uncharacterized protein n=1 Tax=Calocera viscosa (strain TUFC12733) TaxID=1330018 RepID=A0A167J4D1_CALVF|nr:hypothetical protein CALVIDRAFT_263536 [Calocera viscosa TUFC12733]
MAFGKSSQQVSIFHFSFGRSLLYLVLPACRSLGSLATGVIFASPGHSSFRRAGPHRGLKQRMWEYIDVCRKRFCRTSATGLFAFAFVVFLLRGGIVTGVPLFVCLPVCLLYVSRLFPVNDLTLALGLRVESPSTLQTCSQSPCATLYRSRIVVMNLHYDPKTAHPLFPLPVNELHSGTPRLCPVKENSFTKAPSNAGHIYGIPQIEGRVQKNEGNVGVLRSVFDTPSAQGLATLLSAYQALSWIVPSKP